MSETTSRATAGARTAADAETSARATTAKARTPITRPTLDGAATRVEDSPTPSALGGSVGVLESAGVVMRVVGLPRPAS